MKTSTWIKIIGIICIVFGALGIIEDMFSLLIPLSAGISKEGLPEVLPDMLKWSFRLSFLTLLSNSIYLIAGIFFLIKKPFSLKLIYSALTFSIFCKIVPMLLLRQFSPDSIPGYAMSILNLRGPFIDLVLLIGVFRVSGYYFKSGEELSVLPGEKKKSLTPQLLKTLTFIGLFCVAVPISIFFLWGYAYHSGNNQADRIAIFNSYFPSFLRDAKDITYLSIVICISAIIVSGTGLTISSKLWKWLNIIILVLSILMMLMNLFSLM